VKRYVDTSLLCSLYLTDANSLRADEWRRANPGAIAFTGLHRVELRNAFRLAVFQQRVTSVEADAAWQLVEEDLAAGRLVSRWNAWRKLIIEAGKLVEAHTAIIGSRSLDVLHVAAALVSGAAEFYTLGKLAEAAGLRVL
jgi:hypothetical protein